MKRRRDDEEPSSKRLFPLPRPLQGRFALYGNICIDTVLQVPTYPKEDSSTRATSFTKTLGGNCANSCRVLAQLVPAGQHVSSLGIIAHRGEADVDFALRALQAGGVETSLLQEVSASGDPTIGLPTSFVVLSADSGARTIISSRRGLKEMDAEHLHRVLEQVKTSGAPLCWCHLECRQMPLVLQMASILRPEVSDLRNAPKPILSVEVEKPSLEVAPLLPLLQRCDVAFFSSDFIRGRASDLLGAEAGPNPPNTNWQDHMALHCLRALASKVQDWRALWICPWGSFGAFALELPSGEAYFEKALAVEAVDSLGAGDTFVAASLCALGGGADPQQALRCACAVAGKKVSQAGLEGLGPAVPADMPWC